MTPGCCRWLSWIGNWAFCPKRRLPDPRSPLLIAHTAEQILRQQMFQILAGYPDGNDAQLLRDDPLFKTIVGIDPRREDRPLASGQWHLL